MDNLSILLTDCQSVGDWHSLCLSLIELASTKVRARENVIVNFLKGGLLCYH